jgi:signal transduction histidine kinase
VLRPRHWSIATRSAVLSGVVMLIVLIVIGGVATALLNRSLLAGVDDAATRRVSDIAAALQYDSAAELDAPLLSTDQRIVAVQVVAPDGTIVRRSPSAPSTPLVALDIIGPGTRVGLPVDTSTDNDMRVSTGTVVTGTGRYTVLVASGSEAAESTVQFAALLLVAAAPVVVAVAAVATYRLIRRSLRSVDAIRARVAAITTSDLAERVPVSPNRDEISALAVTMNDMLTRIEAGHAAQRQFVGDASHELRSPLTAIISALDVAVAHPDLLDMDLATGTLVPEVARMRRLVEDLLLLARADERALATQREPVRLDETASSEVTRLRRLCRHRVGFKAEPAALSGNAQALARVVRNLLDNAARHADSRVEVRVEPDADDVVLTISDDGPGIPPTDRSRVFDRFVRLDGERSRGRGGTGLGLAIVAEIVAAHRGEVSIGERDGGGTVVTVRLPATPKK